MSALSSAIGGAIAAKLIGKAAPLLKRLVISALSSGTTDAGLQVGRNALEGNCLGDDVLGQFLTGAAGGALGEVGEADFKRLFEKLQQALGEFLDDILRSVDDLLNGSELVPVPLGAGNGFNNSGKDTF